jgi:hypothetical protein
MTNMADPVPMSNESESPAAARRSTLSTRRIPTGKTGLILGLIVVAAMLAAFVWVWFGGGAQAVGASPTVPVDSR